MQVCCGKEYVQMHNIIPVPEFVSSPLESKQYNAISLVPRLPNLFNVAREKRGSLVKLITCVTSGGTNFHIWHNSELAGSRGEISHRKLEFFELKGCESASGGPSVRSPYVENRFAR